MEYIVAGKKFRTEADYKRALWDEKKIAAIKKEYNLEKASDIEALFNKMQSGVFDFKSSLGRDFDDEVYELMEAVKAGKITDSDSKTKKRARSQDKNKLDVSKKKADGLRNKSDTSKKHSEKAEAEKIGKGLQAEIDRQLKAREFRRKLVLILAGLIAIGSFGYFGAYTYYLQRTTADYEELASLKNDQTFANKESNNALPDATVHKIDTTVELPDVLDEYLTLYNKNKKLIGWLKIDDTQIDYPVMQTMNNEYYLDHNYNQEYDKNGSLFMDCNCTAYPKNDNIIIYGHHMKSGKMFGHLNKYASEDYYKSHSIIKFDTIYEKGVYQVMYVFRAHVYGETEVTFKYYQFIDAISEKEFDSNMAEMAAMSLYDTGVTAEYGDNLLTLSTCDSSEENGRFVVVAKQIR